MIDESHSDCVLCLQASPHKMLHVPGWLCHRRPAGATSCWDEVIF